MAEFSQKTLNTISAFTNSMGLPTVPGPDGSFSFLFERSGNLTLTSSQDGDRIVVSLGRAPVAPDAAAQLQFLSKAGRDKTRNRFLNAGVAPDGSFVFVISIEEDDFTLQELEQVLDDLISAHDSLTA